MKSGSRGTIPESVRRLTRQAREVSRSVSGVTTGFPGGLLRAESSGVGRRSVPVRTGRLASLVAEGGTRGGALGVVVSLAATPHNNALQPTGPGSILLPRVEAAGSARGVHVVAGPRG